MAQTYSTDTKAQAIARVLAGETYDEVAASLDIPSGTIKSLVHRSRGGGLQELHPRETKAATLGVALNARVAECLDEMLQAQIAFARHYSDPNWLHRADEAEKMAAFKSIGRGFTAIMDRLGAQPGDDDDSYRDQT